MPIAKIVPKASITDLIKKNAVVALISILLGAGAISVVDGQITYKDNSFICDTLPPTYCNAISGLSNANTAGLQTLCYTGADKTGGKKCAIGWTPLKSWGADNLDGFK